MVDTFTVIYALNPQGISDFKVAKVEEDATIEIWQILGITGLFDQGEHEDLDEKQLLEQLTRFPQNSFALAMEPLVSENYSLFHHIKEEQAKKLQEFLIPRTIRTLEKENELFL